MSHVCVCWCALRMLGDSSQSSRALPKWSASIHRQAAAARTPRHIGGSAFSHRVRERPTRHITSKWHVSIFAHSMRKGPPRIRKQLYTHSYYYTHIVYSIPYISMYVYTQHASHIYTTVYGRPHALRERSFTSKRYAIHFPDTHTRARGRFSHVVHVLLQQALHPHTLDYQFPSLLVVVVAEKCHHALGFGGMSLLAHRVAHSSCVSVCSCV